ncbi:unnamed protein product [Symbiodinium natans]|uniref:Uncharacterized protein n=1 Tax=Symbiodinium natans TaxID=878477 RepID=A0A812HTU0_9DINO|nr:unnamed protein product [Symbiodinium natans]
MQASCAKGSAVTLVNALAASLGASDARPAWEHFLQRTTCGKTVKTYAAAETLLVLLWHLRSMGRPAAATSLELLAGRLGPEQPDVEPVLKVLFLLSGKLDLDPGLGAVSRQVLYETGHMSSTKAAAGFLRTPGREMERELQHHLVGHVGQDLARGNRCSGPEEAPTMRQSHRKVQVQDVVEVKASGFFDGPKQGERKRDPGEPPEALGDMAIQRTQRTKPDFPEPDSEPPCLEHSVPALGFGDSSGASHVGQRPRQWEHLWKSTMWALDARVSHDTGASMPQQAAGSQTLRFAWLALHGVSSRCFKVCNGLVQCIAVGPEHALLKEWADICSRCLGLRQLSATLRRGANPTVQALGDVHRDLLNVLDGKLSAALRENASFLQFWIKLQPWLRQLQEVLALSKQASPARHPAPATLGTLPQGQLLDRLVSFYRAQELSALQWQACSRPGQSPGPMSVASVDLVPLWLLQRSLQPLLQSLTARVRGEDGRGRSMTVPEFLNSVGGPLATLPLKLRILDWVEAAHAEEASDPPAERYFGSVGREASVFVSDDHFGLSRQEGDAWPTPSPIRSTGFRVCVSVQSGSLPPPPPKLEASREIPGPRAFRRAPETLQVEVQQPTPRTPSASLDAKLKQKQAQQEYKAALDAQLAEQSAERARRLQTQEARPDEQLAILRPPSPRTLQEARDALEVAHRERMQQATEEEQLLRWKLQRLRGSPGTAASAKSTPSSSNAWRQRPGSLAAMALSRAGLAQNPDDQMAEAETGEEWEEHQSHQSLRLLARAVLQSVYSQAAELAQLSEPMGPTMGATAATRIAQPAAGLASFNRGGPEPPERLETECIKDAAMQDQEKADRQDSAMEFALSAAAPVVHPT